jgi:hypothetical protein
MQGERLARERKTGSSHPRSLCSTPTGGGQEIQGRSLARDVVVGYKKGVHLFIFDSGQ